MKSITIIFILAVSVSDAYSQTDSILKFIFVPHPRSEDQVHESVYPAIAQIDFAQYDVRMLGGDLTYSTSKDSVTLAYCDNLFDLDSPNTLWSFGNHDTQSGHRSLIKNFTERESFYSYARDGVTFVVLDTERDANGFLRTFISGDQLQMVKTVCDTITESRFLILLHHRLLWMINSAYFKSMLTDSIAASSRTMDTTNFYADIFPLLQKVKSKGIQVLLFGGDKSKINISYSPEDSITFYAARLAADLTDSVNNVIVLTYKPSSNEMMCNFVPLTEMITTVVQKSPQLPERFILHQNYPNPFNPNTTISFTLPSQVFVSLKVYDCIGREVATLVSGELSPGTHSKQWKAVGVASGIYFYQLRINNFIMTKTAVLLK